MTQSPLPGTKLGLGNTTTTITVTDLSGNCTKVYVNFKVQYKALGISCSVNGSLAPGHQILQPVNADGTSVFKQGSTVPLKFMVFDANCTSIGTPGVVTGMALTGTMNGTESTLNETIVSTTPDSSFRWDPTAQQWIFNLSTKNLPKNATFQYTIYLNDGTCIRFQFGLR